MRNRDLQLFRTDPHPCSYLPDQLARTEVAVPIERVETPLYGDLLRAGFRRSGAIVYRPNCDGCRACVSVRIPVEEFRPSRSQRRAWAKHESLQSAMVSLRFNSEHFALYRRYQSSRHPGGEMEHSTELEYAAFLLDSKVDTRLVEFRDGGKLVMVSVIDVISDGLSSVYTFFDPDIPGASLGVYSILWQIEECRRSSLTYQYLGYWIEASRKMSYKTRFQPIDGFVDGAWRRLLETRSPL